MQKDNTPAMAVLAIFGAFAALALAISALVLVGVDDDEAGGSEAVGTTPHVELSEFAITPGALTAASGSSLHVANVGSVAHNFTVREADVATADLDGGASAELDLSGLEPGEYEVFCSISGHEQSGMTGVLTVTDAGTAAGGEGGEGEAAAGEGEGGHMTEAEMQEMSDAMNASIEAYPAETEGVGNPALAPTVLADGTKQFELTAAITPWEVEPGKVVDAWTYNGTVPGPMIHVDVGDRVQIILHNELPMGTDLHVHGVNVPNSMDGVAPLTQPLIEPGQSFTYEFVTDEPAVAMYHAHHHGQMQVPNGLLGTFLVGEMPIPAGRTIGGYAIPADVTVSQELPIVLNDAGVIGFSINGKSFPAGTPIMGELGSWILVHYFNEGAQIHPMHLHQFDQIVIAKDGFPLDQPYIVDTLNVAPGERYSVLVQLKTPGAWVWHCHILNHVERDTGMFGMVTAVIVE